MRRITSLLIGFTVALTGAEGTTAISDHRHLGTDIPSMSVHWRATSLLGQPVIAAQIAWTLPEGAHAPFWRDQVQVELAVTIGNHSGWLPLKTILPEADGTLGTKGTRSAKWDALIISDDSALNGELVKAHWPEGMTVTGLRLVGGEDLAERRQALAELAAKQVQVAQEELAVAKTEFAEAVAEAETKQREVQAALANEEHERVLAQQLAQGELQRANQTEQQEQERRAGQHTLATLESQDREVRDGMAEYHERQGDAARRHQDDLEEHQNSLAARESWRQWEEKMKADQEAFARQLAENNRRTQELVLQAQQQKEAERQAHLAQQREAAAASAAQREAALDRQRTEQAAAAQRAREEQARREQAAEAERQRVQAEAARRQAEEQRRRQQQAQAERQALVNRTKRIQVQSTVANYPGKDQDAEKKGTCTVEGVTLAGERVGTISIRFSHSHFMGEPMQKYIMQWTTPDGSIKNAPWGSVHCKLAIDSGGQRVYVTCSPLVEKAGKWSWDVAGSPNWNDFYQTADGAGIDADTAKAIYLRGGSIRIVEIWVP